MEKRRGEHAQAGREGRSYSSLFIRMLRFFAVERAGRQDFMLARRFEDTRFCMRYAQYAQSRFLGGGTEGSSGLHANRVAFCK